MDKKLIIGGIAVVVVVGLAMSGQIDGEWLKTALAAIFEDVKE